MKRRTRLALLLGAALVVVAGAAGTSSSVHDTAGAAVVPPATPATSSATVVTVAPSTTTSTTTTTLPGQGSAVFAQGGTVTVAVPSLPSNFNPSVPAGANRVTAMVTEQVWPQAFTVNPQLAPVLDGAFVTSAYLTGMSPQTIVYTIAAQARWSDGVPITAADFTYLWHAQLKYGPMLPANDPVAGYQDIKSITGSNDGKTVTVVFDQPYSSWEALFANLVPAHVGEQSGFATAFAATSTARYVSGGPYAISKYVPGDEVVLTRNSHYWGPPAHVQTIVFKVAAGDRAVLSGLRDGSVTVGEVSPSPTVSALVASSNGALASGTQLGPTLWQLVFNLARPSLSQPSARQAIAKAVDRSEILADTVGLVAPAPQTSGNRLFSSGASGSRGNDGGYTYANDAQADGLLMKLGDTLSTTGLVLTPSGAPLTFTVVGPTHVPIVTEIEALLQAQLLQAGITLEVKNVPESQLLAITLPSARYEIALAPFDVTPYPSETESLYTDPVGPTPLDAVSSSGASATTIPGALPVHGKATNIEPGAVASGAVSRDVEGLDDPEVTALYAEAQKNLSPPSATQIYNQIDAILWQDMPTLPLFQMPMTLVARSDILNMVDSATWAGPMWNAEDWIIQLSPAPGVTTTTAPG